MMSNEKISAFMDGEERLSLDQIHNADGLKTWEMYHFISDVARQHDITPTVSADFLQRIQERVAQEPKPFMQRRKWYGGAVAASVVGILFFLAYPHTEQTFADHIANNSNNDAALIKRQQQDYQNYIKAHMELVSNNPNSM